MRSCPSFNADNVELFFRRYREFPRHVPARYAGDLT
jgi:hypothetical protein